MFDFNNFIISFSCFKNGAVRLEIIGWRTSDLIVVEYFLA